MTAIATVLPIIGLVGLAIVIARRMSAAKEGRIG
jgi:hypothetical protein